MEVARYGVAVAMIATLTAHALYDVWAVYRGLPTISAVLRGWSREWAMLPFCVGVLVGHVFWGE